MNKVLLGIFFAMAVWSAITPADRFTWWLEVMPAFIGLVLMAMALIGAIVAQLLLKHVHHYALEKMRQE